MFDDRGDVAEKSLPKEYGVPVKISLRSKRLRGIFNVLRSLIAWEMGREQNKDIRREGRRGE